MKYLAMLSLAAGLTPAILASTLPVSADQIEQRIQTEGARGAASTLSHDEGGWNLLLDHVSSGDPAWLKVAEDLRPGTVADETGRLDGAVTAAIQRNPDGVLTIIGPVFQVTEVCTVAPEAQQREFIDRTRGALEGVTRPALATRRSACLRSLPQ